MSRKDPASGWRASVFERSPIHPLSSPGNRISGAREIAAGALIAACSDLLEVRGEPDGELIVAIGVRAGTLDFRRAWKELSGGRMDIGDIDAIDPDEEGWRERAVLRDTLQECYAVCRSLLADCTAGCGIPAPPARPFSSRCEPFYAWLRQSADAIGCGPAFEAIESGVPVRDVLA